jgi:cytochrome c peroxidase
MKTPIFVTALVVAMEALSACETQEPRSDVEKAAEERREAPEARGLAAAAVVVTPATKALFAALPERYENVANPLTDEKISLGRMLFFDARLSKNHDVSCNSCHGLDTYGVDKKPFSPGHKGALGGRNSPTVYNAGGHVAQFWDGRAKDLEEQALGPVMNPVEMAMPDEASVVAVLESIPEYVAQFKVAFPDDRGPVTFENMGRAIAAFERTLVTPSRFDSFLKGDDAALTVDEKQGLNAFVETGCVACHNGAHLGGAMYQKVGSVTPWPNEKDLGRFDVTKNDVDRLVFRVPALRNVAETAPYFHDGSTASLDEAVRLMAKHQLGRDLSDAQTRSIETFLKALTGELPRDRITPPTLPPSTDRTPKPSAS